MSSEPAEDLRLERGQVLKIWHFVREGALDPSPSIGRMVDAFKDHILLNTGSRLGPVHLYYDRIQGYERMPDPGQFSTIAQNARIHYDSASDCWEEGEYHHWTVGACVQDVRKLLEVIEVMEAMRDHGVF